MKYAGSGRDEARPMKAYTQKPVIVHAKQMQDEFKVITPGGILTGKPGDFLVWGVGGELYPVDEGAFAKAYEFGAKI